MIINAKVEENSPKLKCILYGREIPVSCYKLTTHFCKMNCYYLKQIKEEIQSKARDSRELKKHVTLKCT